MEVLVHKFADLVVMVHVGGVSIGICAFVCMYIYIYIYTRAYISLVNR